MAKVLGKFLLSVHYHRSKDFPIAKVKENEKDFCIEKAFRFIFRRRVFSDRQWLWNGFLLFILFFLCFFDRHFMHSNALKLKIFVLLNQSQLAHYPTKIYQCSEKWNIHRILNRIVCLFASSIIFFFLATNRSSIAYKANDNLTICTFVTHNAHTYTNLM